MHVIDTARIGVICRDCVAINSAGTIYMLTLHNFGSAKLRGVVAFRCTVLTLTRKVPS
jgi:hypothetical protein